MKKSFVFSLCAAMTLLAACNESENWTPNTGCTDGDARCDSDKLYTCKDGDWVLGANCADSGKVCGQNAENKPACVSGPKEECVPSCKDGVVTLCDSDGNAMTHQCTDGQVCGLNTKGTPACVTMPQKSCMPYCKNGGIVTCDENMNEVFDECPDNKICEMDENHQPACVGMKSCMPMCANGVLTTCDADMNEVTKTCDDDNKVCGFDENGVPACVDAAKSCMPMCANGVLTTCDADMNEVTKTCSDENKVCGFDENGVPACVEAVVCAFGDTMLLVGDKACDAEGKVVECKDNGVMSDGVECTDGVCTEGECVRRDCDDVADGKNVCKENKLMVCDDGELVEDTDNACADTTPLCRDGEFECSAYKDCDTINHGKNGCKNGNIVACNDGETSVIDGGNCAELSKVCIANEQAEAGYICKDPDPTDCTLDGVTVAKNETICDGNVLKTCSLEKDGVLSDGVDCASVNNGKPYCDPKLNICRAYYNCGDNDEIAHEAIACNAKGTNKAECKDGKLVDLTGADACSAVDNAVSVCTFDTEAVCSIACKPGYFLKNNACEEVVTCDTVKEKYNKDDNTCSCNAEAHWEGNAGSCACGDGYVQIGTACVAKQTCSTDAHTVLDLSNNTCVCDNANHWVGDTDWCQCKDGYVEIDNACVPAIACNYTEFHTIWDEETNTCICDEIGHWTKDGEACVCADGYVQVSNECQLKRTCNANREKYSQTTNTCSCDDTKGWVGTAGSCRCDDGKVQVGNACQDKVTCTGDGQIYVENANICACDGSKGWIGDGETCACPNGYVNLEGVCTLKAICDANKEVYVPDDNTCACDSDNGWEGTAGSCACDATKHLVYDSESSACACDISKGWTGTAGSCACPKGTKDQDGACVSLCTAGFVWDDVAEACSCDTANGWAPDELYGGCKATAVKTMTLGHYEQDNDPATTDEPITWRILAVDKDGKALITSEKALDVKPYNTTLTLITWEGCTLRSWLNGYDASYNTVETNFESNNFIDTAFTKEEQEKIADSNVPAHENPEYPISPGNATTDKIFLISFIEAQYYFSNDDDRRAVATPYVQATGIPTYDFTDLQDSTFWWLRTPGETPSDAASILDDGSFYTYGDPVNSPEVAVRPALWVKL